MQIEDYVCVALFNIVQNRCELALFLFRPSLALLTVVLQIDGLLVGHNATK